MVAGLGSLVSLCIGGEKDFFEHIGNECGGLIELDQRTENFKYLFEAGIKNKKSHVGFLPQIVIINEGSKSYFVKIRPLSPTIRSTISRLPSPKIAGSTAGANYRTLPISRRSRQKVNQGNGRWARPTQQKIIFLSKFSSLSRRRTLSRRRCISFTQDVRPRQGGELATMAEARQGDESCDSVDGRSIALVVT
ncbi:hypothetical protein GBA52_024654 [Prunus armeniaca]|nr:hypothetical protein GBA52_024654 [Prunus armeniaca]